MDKQHNRFKTIMIALESTSFYGVHIATYFSTNTRLMAYNPYVYCLNPKTIANYRKSFIGMGKTDPQDAYIIADFARVGRIDTQPLRGSQYLALQLLTRHRLYLIECLTREKTYMPSNMFLKFSELAISKDDDLKPFSNRYSATAEAILTEFKTAINISVYSQSPESALFMQAVFWLRLVLLRLSVLRMPSTVLSRH